MTPTPTRRHVVDRQLPARPQVGDEHLAGLQHLRLHDGLVAWAGQRTHPQPPGDDPRRQERP